MFEKVNKNNKQYPDVIGNDLSPVSFIYMHETTNPKNKLFSWYLPNVLPKNKKLFSKRVKPTVYNAKFKKIDKRIDYSSENGMNEINNWQVLKENVLSDFVKFSLKVDMSLVKISVYNEIF